MPKFLYTVVVFAATLWWLVLRFMTNHTPSDAWTILLFLLLAFVALTLTFSIPLYIFFHRKAPEFANLRFLYRKSIKWSMLAGFFTAGVLGLRAFDLGTMLNIGLFTLLCSVLGFQFGKSR